MELHEHGALKPLVVSVTKACELLGDKNRSCLYAEIKRGRLVAIKDGTKTLITFDSIERYIANLQRRIDSEPASLATPESRRKRKLFHQRRSRKRAVA